MVDNEACRVGKGASQCRYFDTDKGCLKLRPKLKKIIDQEISILKQNRQLTVARRAKLPLGDNCPGIK